jgi:hypothetical protein
MGEGYDRVGFAGHVRDAQAHDGTHAALARLERRGTWTSDGRREGPTWPGHEDENAFLESHSWEEYANWHLALTDGATDETKGRYAFVYGDFRRLHRMGLIACQYRAAEWRHKKVELAAHDLLQYLDKRSGWTLRGHARGKAEEQAGRHAPDVKGSADWGLPYRYCTDERSFSPSGALAHAT